MSLDQSFRHRDLIEKHGNKGAPGYRLLHPGRGGKIGRLEPQGQEGPRTKKYNDRLRAYGAALQRNRGETDLVGIAQRVMNDSLLDDDDYQEVLNEIERAGNGQGPGDRPVGLRPNPATAPQGPRAAAPPKKAAPAKAPAKAQTPAKKQPGPITRRDNERGLASRIRRGGNTRDAQMDAQIVADEKAQGNIRTSGAKRLAQAGQKRLADIRARRPKNAPHKFAVGQVVQADLGGGSALVRIKAQIDNAGIGGDQKGYIADVVGQPGVDAILLEHQVRAAPKKSAPRVAGRPARPAAARNNEKWGPGIPNYAFNSFGDDVPAAARQIREAAKKRIRAAKNLGDLDSIMQDLGQAGLPQNMEQSLLIMAEAKADVMDRNGGQMPASLGIAPIGRKPRSGGIKAVLGRIQKAKKSRTGAGTRAWPDENGKMSSDPKHSPAGKALAGGAKIEDLKDPDGMVAYITRHGSPRFRIKPVNNGQVSKAYEVFDDDNGGKAYFFKEANNGGFAAMFGDGVNEIMAARLGRAAFKEMFPDVQWADNPDGQANPGVRMDHLADFVPNAKKVHYDAEDMWNFRRNGKDGFPDIASGAQPIKDPRNPLAIHIFDYLIDNNDRHPGNYGNVETPGGRVIVPLDNGAGFLAYNAMGRGGVIPDEFIDEPETISYDMWAQQFPFGDGRLAKPRFIMREARVAYEQKGWGPDKMKADVEKILDAYKKAKYQQILDDLLTPPPPMDQYETAHARAAADIWKNRIDMINAEAVVKAVLRA